MMFYYVTEPLDWFGGMVPLEDFFIDKLRGVKSSYVIEIAMCAARVFGKKWDGDIACMFVFAIPDPTGNDTRIGLVWKQGDNGTTFIASPTELRYLTEYLVKDE